MEDTINTQRCTLTLVVAPVPGHEGFYQVTVQALVERESNPTESIAAPAFGGSAFGREPLSMHSDYQGPKKEYSAWAVLGHDPTLEKKVLDELFKKI